VQQRIENRYETCFAEVAQMRFRLFGLQKLVLLLAVTGWGGTLFLAAPVRAETSLNRAIVQSLRNSVRLLLQDQAPRSAKVRDALTPGDALSTARASLAELRFNDGSLARIGERALFRFLPNTRAFRLNNGTVLLLIPPGRGRTQIQTPNATAGIRGSALFVRYLPETDTTLVGALTDSGIEVSNRDRSQNQALAAGQMAVIVKGKIDQLYNFDLKTFYETSNLVKGLNLSGKEPINPPDPAIEAVQAETVTAAQNQTPIATSGAPQNPNFLQNPAPAASSAPAAVNNGVTGVAGTVLNSGVLSPVQNLTEKLTAPILTPLNLNILQPSAIAQPTTLPPTIALPITPGQTGILPGVVNTSPGQGNSGLPGLPGIVPGLTGNAPAAGNNPAGSSGAPAGLGNVPNQLNGNNGPPGLTGTAPGLAGTSPGRGGSGPPGQTGTAPGRAGTNPGRGGR
jgi:hypothetical protein